MDMSLYSFELLLLLCIYFSDNFHPFCFTLDVSPTNRHIGTSYQRLDELPADKAVIDFGAYNFTSVLSKNVPEIQKIYEGAKVDYPTADTASIDTKQKTTAAAAAALIKTSGDRLAALEGELAALNAEAPLNEMSTEEFLADKPELKAKIAADLEKGAFM